MAMVVMMAAVVADNLWVVLMVGGLALESGWCHRYSLHAGGQS